MQLLVGARVGGPPKTESVRTADGGRPPAYGDALLVTGAGVRSNGRAQTLAVASARTPAAVPHAGLVVRIDVHLETDITHNRRMTDGRADGKL